jgi:ABC-type Na+ efflux pump permease subunit
MILNGTQAVRNISDMANFGSTLFQILAPLQLALILFLSAIQAASNIAVEKDRQTLILLLMSRLTNSELVLGKLLASLLNIGVMLIAAAPIFMLIVLFGGTSFAQVGWTFAVTAMAGLAAGSLGVTVALWREKTFQSLALVAMILVAWLGLAEVLNYLNSDVAGFGSRQIGLAINPLRAVMAASQPSIVATWMATVVPFLSVATVIAVGLCALSILRVRRWNPSRDVRPGQSDEFESAQAGIDLFTGQLTDEDRAQGAEIVKQSEGLRSGHVDDRARVAGKNSRRVWDNPVLWREAMTWAYGRKILFIRAAYWLLAAGVIFAIYSMINSGAAIRVTAGETVGVPIVGQVIIPFMVVSIMMINALAVTSITTERDGRALDLLMVTDISPKEFLFGKIGGVAIVAADMAIMPIAICCYLWFSDILSTENLAYVVIGSVVMLLFSVTLGIHSGMSYGASRQAIAVSLGTLFFLFLGVVTVILMMVSFTGNAEAQLAPFLACIIGGSIGLYLALGYNVPSTALVVACGLLPITMFYSITSLLIGDYMSVLLVMATTFGFATLAMMIPRLSDFLVSTGRSSIVSTD